MSGEQRRVLVVELAGLGDNVHLLPALWLVRRHWPLADLHVLVNSHVANLFTLTPWVDRVWAYPSMPKPGLAGNLKWARLLRRQRYDCVINTTGSDRSSLLTLATGAPERIGRRPADGGPPGWHRIYTRVVDSPYYTEPMYWQKWRCLRSAGFEGDAPQFHVTIEASLRRDAGIGPEDEGRYVHVSPFTTAAERELLLPQLAGLLAAIRAAHPGLRLALSCSPQKRELEGMTRLLALLPEPPWRVFAGTLDIAGLAAVIEKSAVSLSGDTGTLHLAMMTGAPALAWFRPHRGQKEWIPVSGRHRALVGNAEGKDALQGIPTASLVDALNELLAQEPT